MVYRHIGKSQIPNRKSKITNHKHQIIFLVGPTAVGKSEIAAILARKIKAEIISCDSMQIYKGMDVLTCQPAAGLRKKLRYHLVSIIPSAKEYNVAQYRLAALRKIKEVFRRGKLPLFVGGTGLYLSVLLDGIFKVKAGATKMRSRLYQLAQVEGSSYLHKKLQSVDPEAALKIHAHDTKRIVRALEVFHTTGKPISQLQRQRKGLASDYQIRIFCLDLPRPELYARIEARVEEMFQQGLAAEVKKLLQGKLSQTASYAIGIRELQGYFAGQYDLEEAKCRIKKNTRNYAKRQLTWFRKDKRIEWIKISPRQKPETVAKKIKEKLGR